MNKHRISIRTFESIIKNLVKLEEERNLLIEQYVISPAERTKMSALIEKYVKAMDQLLMIVDKEDSQDSKLPLITIGCEIEVEDMLTQTRRKLRLVSSTDEIRDGDVSIFSAPGSALLLKKPGSVVELDLPDGKTLYRIIKINAII